ncbi:MAG: class I SAM-dependent methyltransferase [Armatimonadetes bacterium]|nr:class I SAM-dependent methyltransferase [Armatimonadota bacterium]
MSTQTIDRHASFTSVTEMPGQGSTQEGLDMLRTRYEIAARLGEGKDVVEVACGPGMGLGYLLKRCKSVQAGDYDEDMVSTAKSTYGNRLQVDRLDAMNLQFSDNSFDLALVLESIYFMPDAGKVIQEAARVVRPGGAVFVASANREWTSFNPAPFSTRYLSAKELKAEMEKAGLEVELKKGFKEETGGLKNTAVNILRKVAVTFRLIPDTMEGKEKLKRLIFGPLPPLPREIDDSTGEVVEPVELKPDETPSDYKVIYAIGRKPTDKVSAIVS